MKIRYILFALCLLSSCGSLKKIDKSNYSNVVTTDSMNISNHSSSSKDITSNVIKEINEELNLQSNDSTRVDITITIYDTNKTDENGEYPIATQITAQKTTTSKTKKEGKSSESVNINSSTSQKDSTEQSVSNYNHSEETTAKEEHTQKKNTLNWQSIVVICVCAALLLLIIFIKIYKKIKIF